MYLDLHIRRVLYLSVLSAVFAAVHWNDTADFRGVGGGEKSLFPLFLAEGNSTTRSFISNCPGAGVDCASCFFLTEITR